MADPVSRLLLTTPSVEEMANKLIDRFGGEVEDAKIIAKEMSGIGGLISIKETVEFWKTFVLRETRSHSLCSTIGGYVLSELSDLFKEDWWRGRINRSDFKRELESLPIGSILVRTSENKGTPRTAFVLGIKMETVQFWKYGQDISGFILSEGLSYRLLQDFVAYWAEAQGYPINKYKEIEEIECIVCMASPCDTRLMPCKHENLCGGCAEKLECCPSCRTIIESRVKTFV